ncbi:MAG: hypothetical protein KZQ58_04605, partial [gamma proteobacterium symbiont of Bathyaustriella thionipta]|nr:hypothetical protein [gamma proteobacterium symbiont of Bathyaustriella thionipta]
MLHDLEVESEIAAWADSSIHSEKARTLCQTVNESAGGYCMSWHDDGPKVKVGELVGVQSTHEESQFGIGVIRWLRQDNISGLQVGVELMSPASQACKARLKGQKSATEQRCLLLPEAKAIKTRQSLIAPPLPFHAGEQLNITVDGEAQEIRLGNIIEANSAFCR